VQPLFSLPLLLSRSYHGRSWSLSSSLRPFFHRTPPFFRCELREFLLISTISFFSPIKVPPSSAAGPRCPQTSPCFHPESHDSEWKDNSLHRPFFPLVAVRVFPALRVGSPSPRSSSASKHRRIQRIYFFPPVRKQDESPTLSFWPPSPPRSSVLFPPFLCLASWKNFHPTPHSEWSFLTLAVAFPSL